MQTLRIQDPHGADGTASLLGTTVQLALSLADRAVLADIETYAACSGRTAEGRRIWDVRPMTDEREHAPEIVDMAREALAYARLRRLTQGQPDAPHLLTLNRRA